MATFKDIVSKFDVFNQLLRSKVISPMTSQFASEGRDEEGGVNEVYFGVINGKNYGLELHADTEVASDASSAEEDPQPLLAVAISQGLDTKDKVMEAQQAVASREILRQHAVVSPFILPDFYRDTNNVRIAPRIYTDVRKFLNIQRHNLSLEAAKKIIGQLLLAVDAFHRKHVVHGDISLENLLITKEGSLFLADLETVVVVNPKTGKLQHKRRLLKLKKSYASEEFLKAVEVEGDEKWEDAKTSSHEDINLKAAEIHTVGITIDNMMPWLSMLDRSAFRHLIARATHSDPLERATITELMKDRVWGETPAERASFFKDLEVRAAEHRRDYLIYSGDFLLSLDPEEDDLFNFLPAVEIKAGLVDVKEEGKSHIIIPSFKEIYAEFRKINNKMQYMAIKEAKEDSEITLKDGKTPIPAADFFELAVVKRNTEALLDQIDLWLQHRDEKRAGYDKNLGLLKTFLQESWVLTGQAISKSLNFESQMLVDEIEMLVEEKNFSFSRLCGLDIPQEEKDEKKSGAVGYLPKLLKSADSLIATLGEHRDEIKRVAEAKTTLSKFQTQLLEIRQKFFSLGQAEAELTKALEAFKKKVGKTTSTLMESLDIVELTRLRREDGQRLLSLADKMIQMAKKWGVKEEHYQPIMAAKKTIQIVMEHQVNQVARDYFASQVPQGKLYEAVKKAVRDYIAINQLTDWTPCWREHTGAGKRRALKFLEEVTQAIIRGKSFKELVKHLDNFVHSSGHNGPRSFNTILLEKTGSLRTAFDESVKDYFPSAASSQVIAQPPG